MKTVVITGSARGLGFNMAKFFRVYNFNVVISDLKEENLIKAKEELSKESSEGMVDYHVCDVSKYSDQKTLMEYATQKFEKVDIWINNAGVNQPQKAIWELDENEINTIIDVDLKGTIYGCKVAMEEMSKNHEGAIYNVEGYGSNDAHMLGLNVYGTSKRAVTYFTESLAQEAEQRNTGVIVGKLSPGIMITDFTTHSLVNDDINLSEKTKKVYNILGDTPETVGKFLVDNIIKNTKNNAKINWLTNRKAFFRFLTAGFNKRDFFANEKSLPLDTEENKK
ncbi:MAG: SDR family oxidoreductase [Clostridia bacterium]|nr:SDR family oxidoreductase [Clostridia bacterium]